MVRSLSASYHQLISELRDKLDLDTLFVPPPAACSTPRGTQRVVNK